MKMTCSHHINWRSNTEGLTMTKPVFHSGIASIVVFEDFTKTAKKVLYRFQPKLFMIT